MEVVSNRIKAAANSNERIHQFYFFSRYAERRTEPSICDFTFGNPHEMPLPGLAEAIRRHAIPLNKDWFAYKTSEAEPQKFVAERLTQELSLPFEPEDIALTNGDYVIDEPRQSEVDCGGQLERLTPMKIEACASTHQKYDHVVADAPARAFRLDPDGTVKFTVRSLPITLTRDAEYDLDISIDPGELDALYRFSMTTPKPPKQTAIRRPI